MTEDLVVRFEALKEKKEKLNTRRIELETTLKTLRAQYEESMKSLKENFGVNNLAEAKALKEAKEKELSEALESLNKTLNEYEGMTSDEFHIDVKE